MHGEVFRVPKPVTHHAEIEALSVNRKRRPDDFPFKVQPRGNLPVHDLPLERLVELAEGIRAQRHGHGLDLPHRYDTRGGLEGKVDRRSRVRRRRDKPKLGGNLAAVDELNLVLVHGADEHVANLQGVVREHRDGSHGVALERQRQPIFPALHVDVRDGGKPPAGLRVEPDRHLALAPGDHLAGERDAREVRVFEVEVIREQRAVQARGSGGEFHGFGSENLILVLGRELLAVLADGPPAGDHRAPEVILRPAQRVRQTLAERGHHTGSRLLLQERIREFFNLESNRHTRVVHHPKRPLR